MPTPRQRSLAGAEFRTALSGSLRRPQGSDVGTMSLPSA